MSSSCAKRLIVVATELPGLTGGAPVRNYYLLKQLAAYSNLAVTLVCLVRPQQMSAARTLATDLGITVKIVSYPRLSIVKLMSTVFVKRLKPVFGEIEASDLQTALRELVVTDDVAAIQFEELFSWHAVSKQDRLAWQARGIKLILDCHNIEANALASGSMSLPIIRRLGVHWMLPHYRQYEAKVAAAADLVVCCSPVDKQYFESVARKIIEIPNGVELSAYHAQPPTEPTNVLFMGSMNYPPNADGIAWYLKHIHPQVKAACPGSELYILGGGEASWLRNASSSDASIVVTGFVPDPRVYLDRAGICICPIRLGSGTRLKFLEYLGAARAIITTTKGAEGITFTPGVEALVADTSDQFADAVIKVITTPELRDSISRAAHTRAADYDWHNVTSPLVAFYQPLAKVVQPVISL